tara:strand:- start:2241 stop:2624 length:384 start_codon:yes stop_codon:yes gene_type:complete
MSQMAAEARNSGFKFLIKEMNKMQVDNEEKPKADKKEAKIVAKSVDKNDEKEKKLQSGVGDNIKELVKGFFRQANQPKKEKEAVDLFVSRPRKRPVKKAVAEVEAPKPRVAKSRTSRAKKKTSRRRA